MFGTIHRVKWVSVTGLGKLAKFLLQINHRMCMKHTAVCSPAFVAKGCTENQGCLASSKG